LVSLQESDGSDWRFARYVDGLTEAIGHADRAGPLRDYCTGLMLPCERKSVEPMAAVTAPARTAAQHQSLLHFVGQAAWSDDKVLSKVRDMVLPAMDRHGPIETPAFRRRAGIRSRFGSASLLIGRIFDDAGNRMTATTAQKRGARYRYYVSSPLQHGGKAKPGPTRRIPTIRSSISVVTPGTNCATSLGASCPSVCAAGLMHDHQRRLVLAFD
jgi:DDE superfamily endonuclease